MTYGSATTAVHVREYFEHIYKGNASDELIEDFENRYRAIGRSPLIDITRAQAQALEEVLGEGYTVRAGMRHSEPSIAEAIQACQNAGATSLLGIILAPQFSSFIMEGYKTAFNEAAKTAGYIESRARVFSSWETEPHFITLLAQRITQAQKSLQKTYGKPIPVLFTTHSMPLRVIEKDPHYISQLEATIAAVTAQLDSSIPWFAGYQSAGHSPEEWLKPDLTDLLATCRDARSPAVLIVPIQFLADHLEILYDLDIAARAQCEEFGIAYYRINLPNTDPLLIQSLQQLVRTSTN